MTIVAVFLTFALIAIPLSFLIKLGQAAFSPAHRGAIRERPVLHALWLVAAVIVTVFLVRLALQPAPDALAIATRRDVADVTAALSSYQREYGRYPLQTEPNDHEYALDYQRLFEVLAGASTDTNENPRRLVFVDFPRNRLKDGLLADRWGSPFHVAADWSGDGAILVGSNAVRAGAAVWSNGKNRINDKGQGDDIRSW